jgi:hypothetical protein
MMDLGTGAGVGVDVIVDLGFAVLGIIFSNKKPQWASCGEYSMRLSAFCTKL